MQTDIVCMYTPASETELSALIRLLEDPDDAVYGPVSKRILEYGNQAIPHLEHVWESSEDGEQQARIETIIRRIHFLEIEEKFIQWRAQPNPDLWEGLLILDQLHYKDDRSDSIQATLEQLRRNAWLELNQYLTPLEQINVLSRVLFEHEHFKGVDSTKDRLENNFICDVLSKRTGNQLGLGVLILVLADKLDLPLYALSIPGIFVLGSPNRPISRGKKGIDSIDFYLDPQSGELFGRVEIEQYLRRIHQPLNDSFFQPMTAIELVDAWLLRVGQKAKESGDHQLAAQVTELLEKK